MRRGAFPSRRASKRAASSSGARRRTYRRDSFYCNATARALAGVAKRPSFRFYHSENYFDSEEYELIRELLLRQGFVECLSGTRVADEDFIWLLGSFEADAIFYSLLRPGQVTNAM